MYAIGDEVWPGVSKVVEEIGELGQVLGKLMGLGPNPPGEFYKHWDGTNIMDRLVEEIADVKAAITFLEEVNGIQVDTERVRRKVALFHQWQAERTGKS